MPIFNELDIVLANTNISNKIPSGTKGVIHQVDEQGGNTKYLVEFISADGLEIIDIVDVDEKNLINK